MPSMSTSRISDLPNEVLAQICRNLCTHCIDRERMAWYDANGKVHRSSLASLCLVSRRFRDVAQPILYHDFGEDRRSMAGQLVSFARTVAVHHPDLAANVSWVNMKYLDPNETDTDYSSAHLSLFHAAAVRLGQDQLCRDASFDGTEDEMGWILALLAHLPNIERLKLTAPYSAKNREESRLWEAVKNSTTLPAILPAMRRLALDHWDMEMGYSLDFFTPIMHLMPGLPRLELYACVKIGTLPSGLLSNVRELWVDDSALTVADLRSLLGACTCLEKFSYEAGGGSRSQALDAPEFQGGNVSQALIDYGHGATLRKLELDLSICDWFDDEAGDSDVLFDVRGLDALEELKLCGVQIDNQLFVGHLPPSLRRFAISKEDPDFHEDLMALARVAPKKYPSLKEVQFFMECDFDEDDEWESLEEAFSSAGVAFDSTCWATG